MGPRQVTGAARPWSLEAAGWESLDSCLVLPAPAPSVVGQAGHSSPGRHARPVRRERQQLLSISRSQRLLTIGWLLEIITIRINCSTIRASLVMAPLLHYALVVVRRNNRKSSHSARTIMLISGSYISGAEYYKDRRERDKTGSRRASARSAVVTKIRAVFNLITSD